MHIIPKKRGQAVQEFLYTYGYALLGAIVILITLQYMGVGKFDYISDDYCRFYSGIRCVDFNINSNKDLTLVIENEIGYDITNINVTAFNECQNYSDKTPLIGEAITLRNAEMKNIIITCRGYENRSLIEKLQFNYTVVRTGTNHSKYGELKTRIR